jgi:hypothetical protein
MLLRTYETLEVTEGEGMSELYLPVLNKELLKLVSKPIIQSLLYDLDLLPEQLISQKEMTIGLFRAYCRLEGFLMAFKAMEMSDEGD